MAVMRTKTARIHLAAMFVHAALDTTTMVTDVVIKMSVRQMSMIVLRAKVLSAKILLEVTNVYVVPAT